MTRIAKYSILFGLTLLATCLGGCSKPPEPSDDIVKADVQSKVIDVLVQQASPKPDIKIVNIEHGETLTANQSSAGIPQGTEVYPIKITLHVKGPDGEGDTPIERYFYKDVYDNWQSMDKPE